MFKRVGYALAAVLIQSQMAWANIGSGSSRRMFMTDFLVDLYNITNNVYVPVICAAVVLFCLVNIAFGMVRIGPVLGRVLLVVGLAGLGVTGIMQGLGGNMAAALLG